MRYTTLILGALLVVPSAAQAEISQYEKTLTMFAIVEVYHNNCGPAFRDENEKVRFTNQMLSAYGQATIADAYLQIDDKRKKFGAEKFCSSMKPVIEKFRERTQ